MEQCPNTLCAYQRKTRNECSLFLNLVADCVCYQAFIQFSKTIDEEVDRECIRVYNQWQEIKNGNLPKLRNNENTNN